MAKLLLIVCLLNLSAVLGMQPDYYWMPFTGELPHSAFMGACDNDKVGVYLGKAHYPLGVLPGYVHDGDRNITGTAEGKVFTTDSGIMVMCTRRPNYYEWVPIKRWSDVPENVHFVESGREPGVTLLTARIQHDGHYLLGKVYFFSSRYLLAEFVYNGRHIKTTSFEILVHRDEPVTNHKKYECKH